MTLRPPTEHHLEFLGLKGYYTGSSESTLVKILHCWKSHVAPQKHIHRRHMLMHINAMTIGPEAKPFAPIYVTICNIFDDLRKL